ncbi:hypothetical protein LCGC14_1859570 [marine sediment metagenome]|uniref:Uncharacterized protein n=1 Tax=marine sediment metagenome TaxID=412755 RepID=A0A0F9G7S0_9ZZZZ
MRLLLNLVRLAFWIWVWRPVPRNEWLEMEIRVMRIAWVIQRMTSTVQEATQAFSGLVKAWDSLPDAIKEEVRRLDASP